MTNEQKYKTPEKRVKAFGEFCNRNECLKCAALGNRNPNKIMTCDCVVHWLSLDSGGGERRSDQMSWHKFWFWYCAIFAISNTVVAMLSLETWLMYLDAWCAIVLVVCATVDRYRADNEREVHNGNDAS